MKKSLVISSYFRGKLEISILKLNFVKTVKTHVHGSLAISYNLIELYFVIVRTVLLK